MKWCPGADSHSSSNQLINQYRFQAQLPDIDLSVTELRGWRRTVRVLFHANGSRTAFRVHIKRYFLGLATL
jgi:hypothetical protein